MQRYVRDLSKGCFKILQLSEIVRKMHLNPFETETVLRNDFRKHAQDELVLRSLEKRAQMER